MKRLLGVLLRPAWRLTSPIRRSIRKSVQEMFQSCLDQSLTRVGLDHNVGARLEEIILVVDSLMLEVARLEARVQELTERETGASAMDLRKVG